MPKIIVAVNAGFCFGVKKAVETALLHASEKNCYLLGDIIHNGHVVEKLEKNGLKKINDVGELPELRDGESGSVIIRSHGGAVYVRRNKLARIQDYRRDVSVRIQNTRNRA